MMRPRFSVRTLAIFVTLVCAYFGAWEATKRYGLPETRSKSGGEVESSGVPLPCVVRLDLTKRGPVVALTGGGYAVEQYRVRQYHLWLFGPLIKLPSASE